MENMNSLLFAVAVGLTMGLVAPATLAQDALWVLSETSLSLGKIDLACSPMGYGHRMRVAVSMRKEGGRTRESRGQN